MSWEASTWALSQKTGSPSGKAVLLCLANYADDKGRCWPSQNTIAKQTEQSTDSVQRRIKKLEERGLLARNRRIRQDGGWSSDLFVLLMPGIDPPPNGGVTRTRKSVPQSAVPQRTDRSTACLRSARAARVRHKSSISETPIEITPDHPRLCKTEKEREDKGAFEECPLPEADSGSDSENDTADAYAKAAKAQGAVFVFEGSKPWKAWIAYRQRTGVRAVEPPIVTQNWNGKQRRGSFMRSLFPPA